VGKRGVRAGVRIPHSIIKGEDMFQQTYFIPAINVKAPVEIRFTAGLRATLTHISAAAEGRISIQLEKEAGGSEGEGAGSEEASLSQPENVFQGALETGACVFNREDFPGGQYPRILTGELVRLKLEGKAKDICLVLTFVEG
jgi:hypothetical protein